MAQYKHDRFFKFYLRSLYQSKGETIQNIQVRNDEDLEIDFMFIAQSDKFGWQQERLGLFDSLMKINPTIIIEHYSGYLQDKHIQKSSNYPQSDGRKMIQYEQASNIACISKIYQ